MNFLPEKKYGVPSHNFVKKKMFCAEKGDEITRFDGSTLGRVPAYGCLYLILTRPGQNY
jgi:hypothetical protein